MDIKTILTIIHIFGVAIGAGAAFLSDWIFMHAMQDRRLSKDEHLVLSAAGKFVWLGLGVLYLSGIGLVMTDPAFYLTSEKFLLKAGIVVVITINGFFLHAHHLPVLGQMIGKLVTEDKEIKERSPEFVLSGAISIVSWSAAIVLGSLRELPFDLWIVITIYILLIAFGWIVGMLLSRRFLK